MGLLISIEIVKLGGFSWQFFHKIKSNIPKTSASAIASCMLVVPVETSN